jgi:hypothetical protein
MDRASWLVRFEVLCGVLWLLSDGSWLMEWRTMNAICGCGAIAATTAIFFLEERCLVSMLTCSAGMSWLLLSVLWAMGDLSTPKNEMLLFAAKCFFFIALAFMAGAFAAYVRKHGSLPGLLLGRVRFLKPDR